MQTQSHKKVILPARTYRRLRSDAKRQIIFILVFILPVLILYILFYPRFTNLIAMWASRTLAEACDSTAPFLLGSHEFLPFIGPFYYVSIHGSQPSVTLVLGTALVCILLAAFLTTGRRKGHALSIYCMFALLIQLCSCLYFFIGPRFFPYDGADYSVLYMLQQVSTWLFFIVIAGLVVGLISYGNLLIKLLVFFGILVYSFVFGCVRYVVYLYIVHQYSMLYMPVLFFALGPFFDFLYLVYLYSRFVQYMNRYLGKRDRTEKVWQWA